MQPPSFQPEHERPSWADVTIGALLFAAIVFGGGGAEGPINNGAIEATAALALLALVAGHLTGRRPLPKGAGIPVLLLGTLLCLVLAQLISLPPSTWHALPGRELMRSSLSLIGQENSWRALSLEPEATRLFAASVLTPAAIMVAALGATRRDALLMIKVVVVAAVFSAFIGALQMALDYPYWLTFYDGPNPGTASGVFANANHHASLLVVSLIFLAAWVRDGSSAQRRRPSQDFHLPIHPAWIAMPFVLVLVVATGSRAGIGLLVLAVPMALGIALGSRALLIGALALAAFVVSGVIALSLTSEATGSATALQAFLADDPRFTYLPDVLFGARQYWPFGVGAGGFPVAFVTYENLDVLRPETLNHAHNEYLEWLSDFGAVGAVWLLAAIAALVWRLLILIRSTSTDRRQLSLPLAGLCTLLLLGCHSAVDYPIRTDALGAIVGLAAGLIFAPLRKTRQHPKPRGRLFFPVLASAVLGGVLIGAQVMRMRAADASVRQGTPSLGLRPQSGNGLALAAEAQLQARKFAQARAFAARAIDASPLSQAAVSSYAAADTLSNRNGTSAWQVAAAMGWRDRATQLWSMHQAFASQEFATAAARADALMRIDQREEYVSIVRSWASTPAFREALLQRLAMQPDWRNKLLSLPPKPSDEEINGAVATLTALGRAKQLRRSDARSAIETLLQRGQHQAAFQLYSMVQPPPRGLGSLNPDPGFDQPGVQYGSDGVAFDWQLSPAPGNTIEVDPATRTLVVGSDGELARRFAYRYVQVRPGSYALSYRVKGRADRSEIIVACAAGAPIFGKAPPQDAAISGFEQREFLFQVPSSCPVIVVEFWTIATGEAMQTEFDDVLLSAR